MTKRAPSRATLLTRQLNLGCRRFLWEILAASIEKRGEMFLLSQIEIRTYTVALILTFTENQHFICLSLRNRTWEYIR